jgi:hypothetical protein
MGSNIITICRTQNLSPVVDKKDSNTEEWNSLALRMKCARLQNRSKMYTGLGYKGKNDKYDFDLERQSIKVLFQEILAMDFNENTVNEFRREVNQYYEALSCSVPYSGRDFEIGLENDNEPLSDTNRPINVSDYIIYKALFENDIETADSELEGQSSSIYWFYKKSKTQEKKDQLRKQESIGLANSMYEKMKEDTIAQRTMLSELLLPISDDNIDNSITLHKFVNDNPVKFIELFDLYKQDERKFKARLRLRRYCEKNILSKTSYGGYIDVLSGAELANSLEEMLNYMVNPDNKEKMSNYNNKYQEKTL